MSKKPLLTKEQRSNALNVAVAGTSIGKDVADMLEIPIAKGAASILLNILKTIQTMENNKEACMNLAKRAVEMLTSLKQQVGADEAMIPELASHLETFTKTLEEISVHMEGLAKAKFHRRLIGGNQVTGDLQKFAATLDDAHRRLQNAIIIKTYIRVVQLQSVPLSPAPPDDPMPAALPDGSTPVASGADTPNNPVTTEAPPAVQENAPVEAAITSEPTTSNIPTSTEAPQGGTTLTADPSTVTSAFDFEHLQRCITSYPNAVPPPLDDRHFRLSDALNLLQRRLDVPGTVDSVHHLMYNEHVLPQAYLTYPSNDKNQINVGDLGYLPFSPYKGSGFAGDFVKLCNIFEDGLASFPVENIALGYARAVGVKYREELEPSEMFDGGLRWTILAPAGQSVRARVILSQAITSDINIIDFLCKFGANIAQEFSSMTGKVISARDLALITQTGHDQDLCLKKRGKPPSVAPPTTVHIFTSYKPEYRSYASLTPNPNPSRADIEKFPGYQELLPRNRFIKFVQAWDDSFPWNDGDTY